MRAALYTRVSTQEQNTAMQLDELRAYCQRRGLEIAAEYCDQGVSGSIESRPALNKLMADARRRKFDVLIVWKLDRFGRSLKHLVTALADLEALGIALVSLRDNLDLSTPSGRLMFQIIGAMAEFERSLIVERVRAGQAAAKRRGVKFGRPRVKVDAVEIRRLRSEGQSFARIAEDTGLSVGTVFRAASAV